MQLATTRGELAFPRGVRTMNPDEKPKIEPPDEEELKHAPLDGGLLQVPPDLGEEPLEDHLKRLAAAEEHQERMKKGTPLGKL